MPKMLNRLLALAAVLFTGLGLSAQMPEGANRTAPPTAGGDKNAIVERATRRRTLANAREAAASRTQAALKAKGGKVDPATLGVNPAAKSMAAQAAKVAKTAAKAGVEANVAVPGPGFQLAQPDYMFGTASNWHNTKPIHKFVHSLPGLGADNANELGNFIPVAKPMANPYGTDSDYYEIGVQQYTQVLHPELNATKLRGYKDLSPAAEVTTNGANQSNYLGPVIIAKRDRAVRIKMTNQLPTGVAGDLFIPVDTTMMGAGVGPKGGLFTQNRAEFHLHGGLSPWISDGTPHQWVTPANEATLYPKGATFQNVPDMTLGATSTDGVATYFWSNQQSGRFMFYHDHSFGLTRLNVYAGEAAGYLIVDPVDDKLVNAKILPDNADLIKPGTPNYYNYGVPLVIQDKTFVDISKLGTVGVAGGTDPTWDVTKYGGDGSLWYPHVYMPNQNPADISGANAMGRWDYGAWFWPPLPLAVNNNGVGLQHGAEPVPGDPNGTEIPGTPNPSLVPEAFMDTPVINGAAYPKLTVQPKAYRFRILNAANDRFWNLSFFKADPAAKTEVVMVPAAPNALWPATWPTDGRAGGVPDPATAGPSFIQIGNESGFLPTPVVIAPQPVSYNYNRRDIVVLNVADKGLFLGPAERADVVVDFSAFAGQTLILYNDAPAPVPAFDTRLDYYSGDPDQTTSGGAATTLPGFGPNTRTLMQITVAAGTPQPFNLAALNAAFTSTATSNGAFAEAQHLPIVPQVTYNQALNTTPATAASLAAAGMATTPADFANNVYVRIQDNAIRYPFPATETGTKIQPTLLSKAIQELFELDYGRMNATLGIELPLTNFTNQTTIPLGYADPTTEDLTDGTTQYWKITHNGVDTHPVHFHLFDVQIINRVGWDGAVRLPDANELGWKETVKMNPLEDIIVAFRPISPRMPGNMTASTGTALPTSTRVPDVTKLLGEAISWTSPADGNPVTGTNDAKFFGWEYVWHCHILGHEENDFMRPMVLNVATTVPTGPGKDGTEVLTATLTSPNRVNLTWTDKATDETGFSIQRRAGGTTDPFVEIGTAVPFNGAATPNVRTYSDFTVIPGKPYDYQVLAYNQAGPSDPSNIAGVLTPAPVLVSGSVYTFDGVSNVPLPGVTLTFTGGTTALTDAAGNYSTNVAAGFAGTITPSLTGFAFTPAFLTVVGPLTTNLTGQNFLARPATLTISGSVAGIPAGATVTMTAFDGVGTVTAPVTAGTYSLTVSNPYTGTITPSGVGLSFTPAIRSYNAVSTSQLAQNFTAQVTISGTISTNTGPLGSVTLNYTGGSVTTASDGSYSITLTPGWSGTVTPFKTGYFFTPISATYAGLVASTTTNYSAVAGIEIAGQAYLPGTPITPLAGVTVSFLTNNTTNAGSVVTDANGFYFMFVPSGWSGTASASLATYQFAPTNRNFSNVTNTQTGRNFVATAVVTYSGNVSSGATPLAGVRVIFSNNGGAVTTNAFGNYTITLNPGWTGNITPTLRGYTFNPASVVVTTPVLVDANQSFNTVQTISGRARNQAGNGVPNVTINGGPNGPVTTDGNGNFTIRVATGWSGTLKATGAGLTWNPPTGFTYTNLSANVTGLRFNGL